MNGDQPVESVTRDSAGKVVLTFGEALVGYGSDSDDLRSATHFTRFAGGADLNVAVGLVMLGTAVTYATVLGSDAHGDFIERVIEDLGVHARTVRAPGHTGLMFKAGGGDADPEVLQVRRATAFSRHADAVLDEALSALPEAGHLHLTGIALGVSDVSCATAMNLLAAARERRITTSFDPNIRLNLWPDAQKMRAVLDRVAEQVSVFMPGAGEGELLLGTRDPERIAEHYLGRGAGEVVLKLGKSGATAFTPTRVVTSRRFSVSPVDTVGAGDGFAAGYLDGFCRGLDLQDRLDQAAAVGALVTTRRGDLDAMPTREEVDAFMRATPSSVTASAHVAGRRQDA